MSMIQEEYWGLFPTTLFLCDDFNNSMHFILSLKDMTVEEVSRLVTLMKHCGAEVSFDLGEATDFSAIIVDHDHDLDLLQPAFTIEYIRICLETTKIHDISNYRDTATSHIFPNARCMEVVYFRLYGWSYLITAPRGGIVNAGVMDSLVTSATNEKALSINSQSDDNFVLSDDSEDETLENYSEKDSNNMAHGHVITTDDYSKTENTEKDTANATLNDNLPGPTSSSFGNKRAEIETSISKGKNEDGSSSNKWSFLDDLLSDSESIEEENATQNQPKKLPFLDDLSSDPESIEEENASQNQPKKLPFLDDLLSDPESIEEENVTQNKPKKLPFLDDLSSDPESIEEENASQNQPKKLPFLDDLLSDPESIEEENVTQNKPKKLNNCQSVTTNTEEVNMIPSKSNKRTRQPYTNEERSNILNYIVLNNEYSRIKGRELWMIMERRKVCPSRTWQSMKEHFIKQIITDLEPYTFLTDEQKRRMKRVFYT